MKTYAIIGNEYEGIYTTEWSEIKKMIATKPAPIYKSFKTKDEATIWFNSQKNRSYQVFYGGTFPRNNNSYYIFTDGGCRNTGNKLNSHVKDTDLSAWAIAIFDGTNTDVLLSTSKAYRGYTNNQMELAAMIKALQSAKTTNKHCVIVSDSKYVLDGITNWMYSWHDKNWPSTVKNRNAWKQIYDLVQLLADRIEFIWVKGHLTSNENILVDKLLNQAMDDLK